LEIAPLFTAGMAMFTCASATRIACAAQAGLAAENAPTPSQTATPAHSLSNGRSLSARPTPRPIHWPLFEAGIHPGE
jgi:hypothetical protein